MNFCAQILQKYARKYTDEKVQSAKCPFVSLHLLFGVDNETNENYRGIFSFSPLRKTEMENKVAIEKP